MTVSNELGKIPEGKVVTLFIVGLLYRRLAGWNWGRPRRA